jgi:uncharacterized phage protein (TIGR01671 family)
MNRPIKFRAWDTENKEWIANGDAMDLYHSASANCFLFDNDNYDLNEKIEFQQFTGLLDKNGKEIYEGDIVRATYEADEGGGWRSNHPVQGKVYFDTYWGVKFDCRDATQRTADMWEQIGEHDMRNVEVIGNIYENPELINQLNQ